mmetsp:Transcript_14352/g.40894  ORF Transcript_14352/g.40894 Transcript_14352/m.40894 type:complete len:454 (-) Transcript_14352:81-1442(-)
MRVAAPPPLPPLPHLARPSPSLPKLFADNRGASPSAAMYIPAPPRAAEAPARPPPPDFGLPPRQPGAPRSRLPDICTGHVPAAAPDEEPFNFGQGRHRRLEELEAELRRGLAGMSEDEASRLPRRGRAADAHLPSIHHPGPGPDHDRGSPFPKGRSPDSAPSGQAARGPARQPAHAEEPDRASPSRKSGAGDFDDVVRMHRRRRRAASEAARQRFPEEDESDDLREELGRAEQQRREQAKQREMLRRLQEAERQRQQRKEEEDWERKIRRHFHEEKQQRRLSEDDRMEPEDAHQDPGPGAGLQRPGGQGERARRRMQQEAPCGDASPPRPPPPPEPQKSPPQPSAPPRCSSHQFRPGNDAGGSPKSAAYLRRSLQRSMTLPNIKGAQKTFRQAEAAALQELARLRQLPSKKERQKGFKELLRSWHPDKNPQNADVATAVFQRLQAERDKLLSS